MTADDRARVLGRAHTLLHLIDFDEPFGYSVVEAMACGTPVIAFARGSMRELILDGVTGHLVADRDDAVAAVDGPPLDRTAIRERTAARFDVATMVGKYLDVYRDLADTGARLRM